jgi:hypothetical protein
MKQRVLFTDEIAQDTSYIPICTGCCSNALALFTLNICDSSAVELQFSPVNHKIELAIFKTSFYSHIFES